MMKRSKEKGVPSKRCYPSHYETLYLNSFLIGGYFCLANVIHKTRIQRKFYLKNQLFFK